MPHGGGFRGIGKRGEDVMAWDRLLWGIEFIDSRKEYPLIGTVWMRPPPKSQYEGEPTRPILFTTRKLAREWCKNKRAQYLGRLDFVAKWRFRPVRVREKVGKTKHT